jgi:hypothetical protein
MLCDFCSELLIQRSSSCRVSVFVKQLFRSVTAFNVVVSATSTFDNASFIGEVTGSYLGWSTFYLGRGSGLCYSSLLTGKFRGNTLN